MSFMEFPPELPNHLVEVLAKYVGKKSAIGRSGLMARLYQRGFKDLHERQMRECIKYLRRNGYLICSAPGTNGGYYLPETKEEFDEFDHIEFGAKISDMNETRQAMLKTADTYFAQVKQMEMAL
jgi:hypothetical protein